MRMPLLIVVVPMLVFFWAVVFLHKLDPWSVAATAMAASAVCLIMFVRDDAPQHVQNWRRGAEGERMTERTLKPLERQGWTVEHDIQRDGRGNLDNILRGPGGVFLLETKNLAGTISFADGVLQACQFDDPDEIYRYTTLAARLRGQARELSARYTLGEIAAVLCRRVTVRNTELPLPALRAEHHDLGRVVIARVVTDLGFPPGGIEWSDALALDALNLTRCHRA